MEKTTTKAEQTFLIIGTAIAWFAVLLQLYLIIFNRVESLPETIIRFFSFTLYLPIFWLRFVLRLFW